jgi:hypothetical protein
LQAARSDGTAAFDLPAECDAGVSVVFPVVPAILMRAVDGFKPRRLVRR